MTDVMSIDPRTGEAVASVSPETTTEQVDQLCRAALAAAPDLDGMGRAGRAALLRKLADALQDRRDDVVAIADRETGLGSTRLGGELTRTCYQLELFAQVLDEGSFLEATIDHAGDTRWDPVPTCAACWCPSVRSACSGPATSRWPSPSRVGTPPRHWPRDARSSSRPTARTRRPPNWSSR